MTTYIPPKKGAQYIFYAGLVSQSMGQFQANPTIAAGDFKVSIDGGALNNLATLPAVTPATSRMVKFTLSTSEMNGDNITVVGVDAAGSEWDEIIVSIQTSVNQVDDLAALIDALPTAAENADAVWDEDATGHQTQGTFGQAIGDPAADTNTIYKAVVTDATGATVGVDVVAVKSETASIQTDTDNIQTRIPAALVSGRMDSSVGAMAANTMTASALAADAVTEIQSGLATSSALATVQADTDNIQTRLPAALSGDGFMKADLKSIEDELTSGNNATLHLKKLNIINSAGLAVDVSGTTGGMHIESTDDDTIGLNIESEGVNGIGINAFGFLASIFAESDGGGKSIVATDGISVSDGDLTLAAIASAVWANATRTLTAISDSAGITTLLSRIASALNISSGKVESNVKQINGTDVTGDGSGTPWGPA